MVFTLCCGPQLLQILSSEAGEREGVRLERGRIKDGRNNFICSLFSKATSYVNHYLWTFHFHPPNLSPPRTVSTGVLFPSPIWMWPSRVPVSTTTVTPCWLCSEMKMTKQETSMFMQRMERFALKLLPVSLYLCHVKFNWSLAKLLVMMETSIRNQLSSPSLPSLPLSLLPFYLFPLLFQFPIPSPAHYRTS